MNGSRLSNDESFLLGVAELRTQLASPEPDLDAAERALTRIAMRYPEEAEELATRWRGPLRPECATLLRGIEEIHRSDADE